jgi:glycerophosphoryl diester phosphodiesterase
LDFLIAFLIPCTNGSFAKALNPGDIEQKETISSRTPAPNPSDNNVVAHRGVWKETGFPDNSLAALNAAISLGCFASECDIHLTRDNRVVVFHDDTFGGMTLKDTGYEELCAAGSLPNGEKIPLLEDFIDVIMQAGSTKLWIDVKSVPEIYGGLEYSIKAGQEAARIVHEKNAGDFIEFIAGREEVFIKCISAAKGKWKCGYMNTRATPAWFRANGFTWANFNVDVLYHNQELIKSFVNHGVRVSTYNADTEEQMKWFRAQKIYAVCTNYPVKMLKMVRGK